MSAPSIPAMSPFSLHCFRSGSACKLGGTEERVQLPASIRCFLCWGQGRRLFHTSRHSLQGVEQHRAESHGADECGDYMQCYATGQESSFCNFQHHDDTAEQLEPNGRDAIMLNSMCKAHIYCWCKDTMRKQLVVTESGVFECLFLWGVMTIWDRGLLEDQSEVSVF